MESLPNTVFTSFEKNSVIKKAAFYYNVAETLIEDESSLSSEQVSKAVNYFRISAGFYHQANDLKATQQTLDRIQKIVVKFPVLISKIAPISSSVSVGSSRKRTAPCDFLDEVSEKNLN